MVSAGNSFSSSPSTSQVKKAAHRIKKYLRDPAMARDDQYAEALDVIQHHRRAHYPAMNTAAVSLRGYCSRWDIPGTVSERLKRMETILDKLCRHQNMDLSKMQDIGGCRVIVPTIENVRLLQERLLKNHPGARVSDYVDQPRSSGYRAVHIVTEWGTNPCKPIEIQLRSAVMHQWADMVEFVSQVIGVNYKVDLNEASPEPSPFQQWAKAFSEVLRVQEEGGTATQELLSLHQEAWQAVLNEDQGGGVK